MIRFTKNVAFLNESWDYGNNRGLGVSIGDPPLLRFAVSVPNGGRVMVQDAVYERVKVYVDSLAEVPAVCTDEEEEDCGETIKLFCEPSGRLFYWEDVCIRPGQSRPMTSEELTAAKAKAVDVLHERLEATYQAGLLLAEGRVVT